MIARQQGIVQANVDWLGAQTLDIYLPENCEDLFISVLYSAATACKRLQLLAMASGDYMAGNSKGAVVRTCGSYCTRKPTRWEVPGREAG